MGKTEGQLAATAALREQETLLLSSEEELAKFHKRGLFFSRRDIIEDLAEWANLERIRPSPDGKVGEINGQLLEQQLAEIAGGVHLGRSGCVFDVVKDDIAWEVKSLSNLGSDRLQLEGLSPQRVLGNRSFDKAPPKEIARRVFKERQRKHAENLELLGINPEHRRLAILAGRRGDPHWMWFWEEPYVFDEELLDRLTWHKNGKGISGKLNGNTVLSWFPSNRGELKYKPPQMPSHAIPLRVLNTPLGADEYSDVKKAAFRPYVKRQLALSADISGFPDA